MGAIQVGDRRAYSARVVAPGCPHGTSRISTTVVVALLALCAMLAPVAHAESLLDAYRQALQQDPILKQAEAASRIGRAGAASARAVLLPQINGSVTTNDSHGTTYQSVLVDTPNGPAFLPKPPQSPTTSSGGLRSRSDTVALNQVLFDLGDVEQWRAGKAAARASEAQYVLAQQDLILRVAQAYFTVLTDEDELKFARGNAASLKKRMEIHNLKWVVGESRR